MEQLLKLYKPNEQIIKIRKVHQIFDEFECPICLDKASEGFKLNECLHTFCKDCLKTYITTHTDGFVLCPYKSNETDCENYIKDYEIKFILDNESDYDKFQLKYLKQIEAKLENPFHCKTLDCIGFYNYVDNKIKHFHCPLCGEVNCLQCDAIHKGRTCYQYKEELEKKQPISKQDENELEELIKAGEIMKCPKCNIWVQKRDGQCQYIRCFYCKMDICWLTRGPRWGPGGKGDISGGCKCGVNGKRCHPECTNCH